MSWIGSNHQWQRSDESSNLAFDRLKWQFEMPRATQNTSYSAGMQWQVRSKRAHIWCEAIFQDCYRHCFPCQQGLWCPSTRLSSHLFDLWPHLSFLRRALPSACARDCQ